MMRLAERGRPEDERRKIDAGFFDHGLTVCRLGPEDLGRLMDLRARILGNLEHADMYVPEDNEAAFVSNHLGTRGMTFGVLSGSRLVSYGMLGFPEADDDDNLGALAGLDIGQRGKVAHLASCMTLDEFRGSGLQTRLAALRMDVAWAAGRRYCIAMVSLHNDTSRRNLLASGMVIRSVEEANGLKRQFMVADLLRPTRFGFRQKSVAALDFTRQCELTRRGWWGVAEFTENGVPRLTFRRARACRDR